MENDENLEIQLRNGQGSIAAKTGLGIAHRLELLRHKFPAVFETLIHCQSAADVVGKRDLTAIRNFGFATKSMQAREEVIRVAKAMVDYQSNQDNLVLPFSPQRDEETMLLAKLEQRFDKNMNDFFGTTDRSSGR